MKSPSKVLSVSLLKDDINVQLDYPTKTCVFALLKQIFRRHLSSTLKAAVVCFVGAAGLFQFFLGRSFGFLSKLLALIFRASFFVFSCLLKFRFI